MSAASEAIWFPIANNHHLNNPINNQLADRIQPVSNPHEAFRAKSGPSRKPPIRFSVANNHNLHNPLNNHLADGIQPIINPWETSSDNRSIRPHYWSPIGSQARQTWWTDIPNWLLTEFETAGHVIW
jgi:hypothetical protein